MTIIRKIKEEKSLKLLSLKELKTQRLEPLDVVFDYIANHKFNNKGELLEKIHTQRCSCGKIIHLRESSLRYTTTKAKCHQCNAYVTFKKSTGIQNVDQENTKLFKNINKG